MIYLDNAATSWPKPEMVYQAMEQFLRERGGNPGHGSHSLAVSARQVIEETRTLVARFINAPVRERVVFTLNCTEAINIGLKGLLKPGDHVITSRLEHNAVVRPLRKLSRQGVQVTRVPVSPRTGITSPSDIEAAITDMTRMIVINHVSNVTGAVQPVGEYGQLARKHGLILLVDAAQSVGHLPVDVQADNIDLLAFSAHKGPLGPPGVGVLYISPAVNPDTLIEGGTGSSSESEIQPENLPDKFESGTLNGPGIAGLGAGLRFILREGPEKVQAHGIALTKALIEGLREIPGVTQYTAGEGAPQSSVVSFNIEGYRPSEVEAILDQSFDIKVRAGLHCAPEAHRSIGTLPPDVEGASSEEDNPAVSNSGWGAVRLSPGYFNTREEIEQALRAVRQIAESTLK